MSQTNKLVLYVGLALVGLSLLKPHLDNIIPYRPVSVDVMELPAPTDENIKTQSEELLKLLKTFGGSSKNDFKRLRDLYLDLSQLIKLDGDDLVVTNTEEIRQANKIAGVMLKLDIKGKYRDLAKESQDVVIAAVGDDSIVLSPELRTKAIEGLDALAWAYNEGSK